ncbi:RNA-binding KH domain-containing protein PEPPER [Heracleum sosnowskyi]|uniref:RNA-binding KH domain-containing protein PEPPER n=1 Tax=Heracleum sosnowskyi TaxID=360622 RepID=A0AAD8IQ23_9APIA|nr:RNA-binding KH domain-containing protein PEPPER [Heracleum sosnowskyi]
MGSYVQTNTATKIRPTHGATATIVATQSKPEQPKWPGWPGHNVYRLIVPVMKVGSIIGRKGEAVKKLCVETRARVRVLDAPVGSPHNIVLISGKEEPEAVLSPAMVAVMRIFKRINGLPEGDEDDTRSSGIADGVFCSVHLLVASEQAISMIGRHGSTIKSIQESSGAVIRVLSNVEVPTFANSNENVVELQGVAVKVIKALESVVGHLRKFLVDHSVLPLFEKRFHIASVSQNQQTENWADKTTLHPTMQVGMGNDDYSSSVKREMLYLDRQRNQDSISSLSGLSYSGQGTGLSGISSMGHGPIVTQVAQTMQIPLAYASDIIGEEGSNIALIRHASGAVLTVQESVGLPDEITIKIRGTSLEVQAAQKLIQECVSRSQEVIPGAGSNVNTEPDPRSSYSLGSRSFELEYDYWLWLNNANAVDSVIASDILKDATKVVAKIIGKPESYVMIVLNGGVPISFAATEEPAAYGELISIGGLGPSVNGKLSSTIADILQTKLSIDASRFYIKFYDVQRSNFGFNGSTF